MEFSNWLDLGKLALTGYAVGKSTAPETPDTSGLNDAARSNAAIATRQQDLAEKQYADQKALFDEWKPMLSQQIQASLDAQTKSTARSDDAWADYKATWQPVEQQLAARSLDLASQGRIDQEAERSAADVAGRTDAALAESRRALIASGASPEKVAALQAAGTLEAAKAVGGARATGRRDAETRAVSYLDNAAKFGRNMPSNSLATAQLAGQQGSQATSGYASLANASAQPAAAASPLFGSAVSANNSAGSLFGAGANADLASQIAQSNATLGGLGAGVKLWGMLNP